MKAVFLDRDGVINRYPGNFKYVTRWQDFHFLPKIKSALKKLSDAGFSIFIISNQAGVAKGIYSREELNLITKNMLKKFGSQVRIAGVFYCTHRQEDNCACRKPKTGLLDQALEALKGKNKAAVLKKSYFIGDSIRDVETGKNAGLKTILVFSGREKRENKDSWQTQPDFTAKDLSEAVNLIIGS